MFDTDGPKGKKKQQGGNGAREAGEVPFQQRRFVKIELTADEKEECLLFLGQGRAEALDIEGLLSEGYSFAVKRVNGGKTVAITLSQVHSDRENAGLMLTAFGPTWEVAQGVLMFKLLSICAGAPWAQVELERGQAEQSIG